MSLFWGDDVSMRSYALLRLCGAGLISSIVLGSESNARVAVNIGKIAK